METVRSFSTGKAFSFGWQKYKENVGMLIGATLVFIVYTIVMSAVQSALGDGIIASIITMVVNAVAYAIFMNVALKIAEGKKEEAFKVMDIPYVNYIIAYVFVGVLTLIGIIALVLPGIYVAVRLSMFAYEILDSKASGIDAVKNSWELTKGNFWNLIGFGIMCGILIVIGLIPLGLGLLVTLPVVFIAQVYVYKELAGRPLEQVVEAQTTEVLE